MYAQEDHVPNTRVKKTKRATRSTSRSKHARSKRIHLRATEREEHLIRSGAEASGANLTDFILQSACLQAEHALADRREFTVNDEQWKAFMDALDRPAKVNPKLVRLLREAPRIPSQD
jgi:uncharacterized protein (DUF1778 family)